MLGPSQNAMNELKKFNAHVFDGLDLCVNDSIIVYCFQTRSLADVVRTSCSDPENINEVADLLANILHFLNTEIHQLSGKMTDNGMPPNYFDQFLLRIGIFHEVDKALGADEKLNTSDIEQFVEYTKTMILEMYKKSENFSGWKKLKKDQLEYFTNMDSKKSDEELDEPAFYAREDGVISSLAFEKALNDKDRKRKSYLKKIEKVLTGNLELKLLTELVSFRGTFSIEGTEADTIIDQILVNQEYVHGGKNHERAVSYAFTELMRKTFLLLSTQKKDLFEEKLLVNCQGGLPNFQNFIENYSQRLTESLNALPVDHQQVNTDPESFEKTKNDLAWFLFATPENTVNRSIEKCLSQRSTVPIIFRVFRTLPTLFQSRFLLANSTMETEPLLATAFRNTLKFESQRWTDSSTWDNAVYLTVSATKSSKKAKDDISEPLLDPYELIRLATSLVFLKPSGKEAESCTKILHRLLANNTSNRSTAKYVFSNKFDTCTTEYGVIKTPELVVGLYNLMVHNDDQSNEVSEYCRDIIKSLGGRLEESKVKFTEGTTNFFKNELFTNCPWWVKYSIKTWFGYSLENLKRQIPAGIHAALAENEKDNFERIVSPDRSSAAECYLRSFFEIGLYDADLAIDLLKKGYDSKIADADMIPKICLALVDSYGKRMTKRRSGMDVGRLLREMIIVLDPSRTFNKLEVWNETKFIAIKEMAHIHILSKAVLVAIEKRFSAPEATAERAYDERIDLENMAIQLLEAYCKVTKDFLDNKLQDEEKLRKQKNDVIFKSRDEKHEGWKLQHEHQKTIQILMYQLMSIFVDVAPFSRLIKPPVEFNALLVFVVRKISDLQGLMTLEVLDDELTDSAKQEIVHGFAKMLKKPIEKQPTQLTPILPRRTEPPNVTREVAVPKNEGTSATFAENTLFTNQQQQSVQQPQFSQQSQKDDRQSKKDDRHSKTSEQNDRFEHSNHKERAYTDKRAQSDRRNSESDHRRSRDSLRGGNGRGSSPQPRIGNFRGGFSDAFRGRGRGFRSSLRGRLGDPSTMPPHEREEFNRRHENGNGPRRGTHSYSTPNANNWHEEEKFDPRMSGYGRNDRNRRGFDRYHEDEDRSFNGRGNESRNGRRRLDSRDRDEYYENSNRRREDSVTEQFHNYPNSHPSPNASNRSRHSDYNDSHDRSVLPPPLRPMSSSSNRQLSVDSYRKQDLRDRRNSNMNGGSDGGYRNGFEQISRDRDLSPEYPPNYEKVVRVANEVNVGGIIEQYAERSKDDVRRGVHRSGRGRR